MKKFLFALCGLLFTFNANAGQMANVEYIHQLIKQEHGIDIKYAPDLISPRQAANMKYLLTAVDVANEILNGEKTTDYGNGEFATRVAVDTTATIQAVRTLIKQDYKFFITTTPDTTEFSFKIQASGEFMVDWGDGKTEKIVKNDTSNQTYSHTYDTADEYQIKMGGKATGYTTVAYYPSSTFSTIHFPTASNITKIDGSLGEIFGTLPDGTNPIFMYTLENAKFTTIPETLFHGITTESKSNYAYYGMFRNSELTTIPEKLFAHTNRFSFQGMFSGCTKLTSIPENLFASITGAPAENMFYETFRGCSGLSGSIPENLFAGIKGAPASHMFSQTFYGCSGLTGNIPENLFAGIKGAPAGSMFAYTFDGCSGLSGSIPENLFAGVSGAPAQDMFYNTFSGCSGLTSIPENLFAGISGAPAQDMFDSTFYGCSGLSGSIPENLFAGIKGAPAHGMFRNTFSGCSGLSGPIPGNLFAGIKGAPESSMFQDTFDGCSGLSGSIPENLFAGISGAPADIMFSDTFYGCSGLSGSIPENLFAGIEGAPATHMFSFTFEGCSGLTGSIPENLFAGIKGAPASYMFWKTFYGCSNLTGYIPPELFAGISTDTTVNAQMSSVFSGTGLDTTCPSGTVQYTTGFESYFNGKVSCMVFEPKFTATTTPDTTTFSFAIQASGEFFVDWGDGKTEKIVKNDTSNQTYTHTYDTPDEYTIKMGGQATGYTTGGSYPSSSFSTIYFPTASNITKIDGSLGEIFGTLPDGTNPIFLYTFENAKFTTIPETLFHGITTESKSQFAYWHMFGNSELTTIPEKLFAHTNRFSFQGMFSDCTKLTSIPEKLFASITGAPTEKMFANTFDGCSGLSGSIPENLFAGIKGAPASYMFYGTFWGCSGLTGSIPENLFAGIEGAPAEWMFGYTFLDCSGLTGSIPENLFAGIEGAPASQMFANTFEGCSNLSGNIPENLFAGIEGAPASHMFNGTFNGCSGLTGYIPPELFAGIGTDTTASQQMSNIFYNTGLDTTCPTGTIQYTTGFESYFNGKVSCEPYVPNATLTTTTNPGRFMIRMTAIGNFTIDWGDGNVEKITRHDTNDTEYWHDYGNADQSYSIKITGRATGYSDDPYRAAISFRGNTQLAYVNGELGEIFPTLDDGTQPGFYETFYECTGMTEISPTLFAGISGAPRARMFGSTFRKCSSLTEIPENLFANITGAPAANVFDATFQECYNLTTIPENLFGGIYGTPAPEMFMRTFHNCSRLTSIPENLFGNISGSSANNMFKNMFEGCSNLTGYSARINGEFLYNIWPNIQTWAYVGCNKLTDYSTMPNSWK